jgi:hypothetical protein
MIANMEIPDRKTLLIRRSNLWCIFLAVICSVSCEEVHYLDQVDKDQLFAYPTSAELETIRQEWTKRDLTPSEVAVVQYKEITENGVMLKIISFRARGIKQYAALVIPPFQEKMPLRIYVNGFDVHNTINAINLEIEEGFNTSPFAFALPSMRGQSLRINVNGVVYETPAAEGDHCDAFDGAADDVIALINAVKNSEPGIDVERVSVRGGSRGGTVALLVAERDSRVKAAIDVAGPTNMLDLTAANEDDLTYQCQFLRSLVENSVTLAEARKKMLASSPVFFAGTLPKTQLHLGENDRIVPLTQGYELKDQMSTLGNSQLLELFIYSNRDHSNIATGNTELADRIENFLSGL